MIFDPPEKKAPAGEWIYGQLPSGNFYVGVYDSEGRWHFHSWYKTQLEAAQRVQLIMRQEELWRSADPADRIAYWRNVRVESLSQLAMVGASSHFGLIRADNLRQVDQTIADLEAGLDPDKERTRREQAEIRRRIAYERNAAARLREEQPDSWRVYLQGHEKRIATLEARLDPDQEIPAEERAAAEAAELDRQQRVRARARQKRAKLKEELTIPAIAAVILLAIVAYTLIAHPDPTTTTPPPVTAICRDGTASYSQHDEGTCSWHDGVSYWVNQPSPHP